MLKLWIRENIKPDENYAGIILDREGEPEYQLVVLPSQDNKKLTWEDAMEAAKKDGGDLPTRKEQLLLFINAKHLFENEWYWSNERDASHSDYAWLQDFSYGHQTDHRKSIEYRARAVRRVLIIE